MCILFKPTNVFIAKYVQGNVDPKKAPGMAAWAEDAPTRQPRGQGSV